MVKNTYSSGESLNQYIGFETTESVGSGHLRCCRVRRAEVSAYEDDTRRSQILDVCEKACPKLLFAFPWTAARNRIEISKWNTLRNCAWLEKFGTKISFLRLEK